MIAAMALTACASDWRDVTFPDDHFSPVGVVAWTANDAVIIGARRYFGGAVIYRFDGTEFRIVNSVPEAHFEAIAALGDKVWAVLGSPSAALAEGRPVAPGSTYTMLVSDDRGATWRTAGLVPYSSVSQLAVTSDGVLWLHATNALAYSADGAVTWDTVVAPGYRDSTRERLTAEGAAVYLWGTAPVSTTDGTHWAPVPTNIAGYHFGAGGWQLTTNSSGVFVEGPGDKPYMEISTATMEPLEIRSNGMRVTALLAEEPSTHSIAVARTVDGGASWEVEHQPAQMSNGWAVAGDGSVFLTSAGSRALRIRSAN